MDTAVPNNWKRENWWALPIIDDREFAERLHKCYMYGSNGFAPEPKAKKGQPKQLPRFQTYNTYAEYQGKVYICHGAGYGAEHYERDGKQYYRSTTEVYGEILVPFAEWTGEVFYSTRRVPYYIGTTSMYTGLAIVTLDGREWVIGDEPIRVGYKEEERELVHYEFVDKKARRATEKKAVAVPAADPNQMSMF